MRKTLLHKGGFGSLSNTWRLLSDANKKHGPRLSLGQCWLVHLSPWLSSALCLDGAPSKAFSLLRERLRKGSPQPNYSLLTQRQARVHLLPSHPATLQSGPWAALTAEQAVWTSDVCGVSLVTPSWLRPCPRHLMLGTRSLDIIVLCSGSSCSCQII